MSLTNPASVGELVGIQSCQQLSLVAEVLIASPERHTRLMPRRWHDGVLTLWTINGKEVQGFVVRIVQSYRHHDMSCADVGPLAEGFLNPELFQFYLTTFLGFLFPFAAFLVFLLVGYTIASMFELYLSTEAPALAKVIPKIDDGMGNIKASVTGVILMFLGLTVATDVVTIIVS